MQNIHDRFYSLTHLQYVDFILRFLFSTAKLSEVKMHVQALLNRHSMTFGNYRWTEFDDNFLHKHVDSVVIDLQETTQVSYWSISDGFLFFFFFFCFKSGVKHWSLYAQPLDLKSCDVSIHVFTLNEEGPSTLSLEEDEDLSAANHWLLPTGGEMLLSIL